MIVRLVTRWVGFVLLAIAIFLIGGWCALAVWFRFTAGEPLRAVLAGAIVVLAVVTVGCLATSRRWLALAVYAALFAVVLGWWTTIVPSNDRDWTPDVARSVTAAVDGDRLVVDNVRNFTWRSDTDFDQRWEQRTYNLSHVTNVDLILSYWVGEAIAHLIVSFGFDDGDRLAFSIETRKESGEAYSTIAGFFRQYELAIVAADERDVVRVRSNVRGEDVRIYRLRMPPAYAQALLREYLADANDLARQPRWYNTLTGNCTTLVFGMLRVIRPGLTLDYRVLLSGYLPDYAYDLGATDTSIPFQKLRELSRIHDKAARADAAPDFSARIRDGLPIPH
ncbi:MAG TPA: DUF4105 domain-containing protein [Acetobacteraceae bacterium]|nr:DUF4105 domain-containing protein [Acetobacteraceae bacterium]